ncbi:MAG: 30S ribosomal protein S4 [Bacteroidetes bacterium]|nr:MAG: 30S ribosomal protein S4 [Bacteroidota bacterium]RLD46425.1 MAG: 30S ribosomal protein S4 [Bacteroidota bacterium]RLD74567.1 MAG: 30S ribosomal protein S4 [Bacteroidota bacterium]RLD89664.1 MAG: 30S ribosomal protein S4 [Bacteroidota bacterium]
MARYIGPKSKIARKFNDPIFGPDKYFEKKNYPPGQHGTNKRRRKQSEYGIQLQEKQKAKYTYGMLERQFRNVFKKASRKKGITGENLLKLIEARLDNVVYRLGISPTRSGARQLVSHRHITVNGSIVNIPSYTLKEGDIVGVRERSKSLLAINDSLSSNRKTYSWLEWDEEKMLGKFLNYPPREEIPENINEQLIVELYSK